MTQSCCAQFWCQIYSNPFRNLNKLFCLLKKGLNPERGVKPSEKSDEVIENI